MNHHTQVTSGPRAKKGSSSSWRLARDEQLQDAVDNGGMEVDDVLTG